MGWNEIFPAGHGKRNTESWKSVEGLGRNLQTGRQKKKKTDRQTHRRKTERSTYIETSDLLAEKLRLLYGRRLINTFI